MAEFMDELKEEEKKYGVVWLLTIFWFVHEPWLNLDCPLPTDSKSAYGGNRVRSLRNLAEFPNGIIWNNPSFYDEKGGLLFS